MDDAVQPTSPAPHLPAFGWALSSHRDASMAAAQVASEAADSLRARAASPSSTCDLAFVFIAGEHIASAALIAREVRDRLNAQALIGISTQAVIGGATELEGQPAISVLAAQLPGARVRTFSTTDLVGPDMGDGRSSQRLAARVGADGDLRALILLADPFSFPLVTVLPELGAARARVDGHAAGVIVGGLASGGRASGDARLILHDQALSTGAVGVSINGPIRVDAVVSQGARVLGENLLVTKAKGNAIIELGGKPALAVLEALFESLPESDQAMVREQGVLLGVVANEYKERFGRADYLVRNVVGADRQSGVLAVADKIRVGQTVRFHVRDKNTADQDLAMLLDAQAIHGPPAGALLITCNQRGTALFGEPSHDAKALARAFAPDTPGEQRAKGGTPIGDTPPTVPIAGFMASGEIGPAGDSSALHGQTACPILFRGV